MPRIEPHRIEVDGPTEPFAGLVFLPPDINESVPLVLLGHGANTSKDDPVMQILCRQLCRHTPAAVVVIDCPAHGERVPRGASEADRARRVEAAMTSADVHAQLVQEWRLAAAAARAAHSNIDDRTAYAGFSMGTVFGFSVVAGIPEVTAALFAVGGLLDEQATDANGSARNAIIRDAAARIGEREVMMLNMTHDEHFPIAGALEVFGMLAGPKRMGVWEGGHADIPPESMVLGTQFLARALASEPN